MRIAAYPHLSVLHLLTLLLALGVGAGGKGEKLDSRSPANQHLPKDCTDYTPVYKKTDRSAGVCVMIKDEEGFLAEFVAFYIVQGVEKLIFYDDNSTDNGLEELAPWVDAGYVTIKRAGTWDGWRSPEFAVTWGQQMAQKKNMERDCKLTLHQWGVDYHISVDLDEYEMPFAMNTTLVDEIDRMFQKYPNRGTFNVNKLQFNAQPHILEPLDKLTIG